MCSSLGKQKHRSMLAKYPEQKFAFDDTDALRQFVQEGYVIYRDVFDPGVITALREFALSKLGYFQELVQRGELETDINGWAVAIMKAMEKLPEYEALIHSPKLIDMAQRYVGPDIAFLGHDALFINVPLDKDPVTLKGHHTDAWTGTGINSIFAKVFLTDVDQYNGLSLCPGSHLQGMMPSKNRVLDLPDDVVFEVKNLDMCKAGDLAIWHALMIHSTTGHSDKNVRVSMTTRFKSTESPMTSQERALGYRAVRVGPLNQVMRLVGNDYATPFRTYGGYVGVDRRMSDIYNHSPYRKGVDYDKYLVG